MSVAEVVSMSALCQQRTFLIGCGTFKKLAVGRERDSLDPYLAARKGDFCVLRVGLVIAVILFGEGAALAAEPMAPNEIKAAFFTGQPFTAVSSSGAKFKTIFTPDGKMTREPLERECRHMETQRERFLYRLEPRKA
jgi:hypothetical protein